MRSEPQRWLPGAALVVALVTAARLAALAFNRTDLFVDESQYWLWGQNLDLGYYSKPPLIAWVIRAVTDLAGSDSAFWVRMPGAVLHGLTALILGALVRDMSGPRAAFWVAAGYVTLPFVTVGSLLFSTDTVMAPFYAAALWAWLRLARGGGILLAALAGAALGLAFLAKYAAIYFLVGAIIAAIADRRMRPGLGATTAFLVVFAAVISPNILWNLTHDLTTVSHTADNIGWVRDGGGVGLSRLMAFVGSQLAVFGPLLFLALVWGWLRPQTEDGPALTGFSLPVFLIVSIQALLSGANANWAVATYFAGTVIAVPLLLERAPWALWLSLALNALIAVVFPVLTVTAPWPDRGGRPLLERYLGRADLTGQIVSAARDLGVTRVMADRRDVLADLIYRAGDAGLAIYAPAPEGRPAHYYEQNYALPADHGRLLYVRSAPPTCDGVPVAPVVEFAAGPGAFARTPMAGYLIEPECRLDRH